MRKLTALAAAVLLICALSLGVSAETGASSVSVYATVSNDGSCQVTLTALLHLEQAVANLTFPLPKDAQNVTLNGSRVRTTKTDTAQQVDLSGIAGSIAGDFSVTLTYTLEDVVHLNEDDLLQLQLPLLSGFAYPVQAMDFSVTLPGQVETSPAFSSGYHQANIEKDLSFEVSGAVISGSSSKELKDHETLAMTLPVAEDMFPQTGIVLPDFDVTNTLMIVSAVLAAIYWLLFLRCKPPRRITAATAPEGYGAGQLGSVLSMQGADLTMMVFTWAQLGYVLIRVDRHGRVMLHKRMDMGNERSGFEQRCFKQLFGRRSNMVDTSGYHYATLWQKVAKMPPNLQSLIHPKSGSTYLFRGLAALIGLFGGVELGIALGVGTAVQWLLAAVLAIFGAVSSWHIHRWADGLFLLSKRRLWLGLALCGIWVLLGALGGVLSAAVWVVLAQLMAGLLSSYGGRRTEAGRQAMSEVLGLRRYLRTVSRTELQRIGESNPEYFYTMAPYALALGVDKAFAKHFGNQRLPDCPYLTDGRAEQLTARQWSARMRYTVAAMDARRRKMFTEKLLGILRGFGK